MSIVGSPVVAKGTWGVDHGYLGRERGRREIYLPLSFAVDLKLFFFLMASGRGVVHKMNVITSFNG